jgi:hypothetical protein
MARFIFYLLDDESVDYIEGQELPDAAAACEQAQLFAHHLASTSSWGDRALQSHHSIRVVGDAGFLVEVKLGESLRH